MESKVFALPKANANQSQTPKKELVARSQMFVAILVFFDDAISGIGSSCDFF